MAILKGGVNGPFSGKVGGIVGYQLNGQNIIRTVPSVTKRKPSKLTLINRQRMTSVSKFLRPIKRIIDFGYKNVAPKGSRVGAFQSAQSHTFRNALDYGADNVPYVNPEKVLVFRGSSVPSPDYLNVTREEEVLHLNWDVDQGRMVLGIMVFLAYDIDNGTFWFESGGPKSSTGSFKWNLGVHASVTRHPYIHVYAAFYDVLRDELSDSVYGGCV